MMRFISFGERLLETTNLMKENIKLIFQRDSSSGVARQSKANQRTNNLIWTTSLNINFNWKRAKAWRFFVFIFAFDSEVNKPKMAFYVFISSFAVYLERENIFKDKDLNKTMVQVFPKFVWDKKQQNCFYFKFTNWYKMFLRSYC